MATARSACAGCQQRDRRIAELEEELQRLRPPIVPIITQFNIDTGTCPSCRQRWQGRHPEQTSDALGAAGNTLGPVVLTLAAEMKHRLGVSYRQNLRFPPDLLSLEG